MHALPPPFTAKKTCSSRKRTKKVQARAVPHLHKLSDLKMYSLISLHLTLKISLIPATASLTGTGNILFLSILIKVVQISGPLVPRMESCLMTPGFFVNVLLPPMHSQKGQVRPSSAQLYKITCFHPLSLVNGQHGGLRKPKPVPTVLFPLQQHQYLPIPQSPTALTDWW